jgi:ribosomal protein S18 acetylase RimI-like enzyme
LNASIAITALSLEPNAIEQLVGILVEAVASGASVSFMDPVAPDVARDFWTDSLTRADAGTRVVLGAWDGEVLAGTVTLELAMPLNQRHRGEIAKLITALGYRQRGIARALMLEAERLAFERGRTLLVLDTAEEGGAAPLYEALGYQRVGVIPDYALKPQGGLTGAIFLYKRIGASGLA